MTVDATATPPQQEPLQEVREVRTVPTGEFGMPHPVGLTYVPNRGELLVAQGKATRTVVLRLGFDEDPRGTFRLPAVARPATVAFDAALNRLTALSDRGVIAVAARELGRNRPSVNRTTSSRTDVEHPRAATFDPATGTWFLLDAKARAVAKVPALGGFGSASHVPLSALGDGRLRGIAFDPTRGLLFVASPNEDLLYGLDGSGAVRKTYSLASLDLVDPRAMTFAPSSDPTDDPRTLNLFIVDAGNATRMGGVTEVTLAAEPTLAAPVVTATLVQTIATSSWTPASPDPSGIVYLPGRDRLQVADSEVDETTGAGYHGVNLWQVTRRGAVTDTGNTRAYSHEPTGLGHNRATDTLFISDDPKRQIFVVKPGSDSRFGTGDDVVTSINAGAYGSTDTEDPEFDPVSGHLFFVDGVGTEIYRINPVNGIFGDGNDVMTHFDVGQFGPTDFEGLGSDPARGTLLVGANRARKIYEITKDGSLVRVIDATGISGLSRISGLAMAPASNGSGQMNYWIVDRAVDNGSNSNENDGKLFEIAVSTSTNNPPNVTNPGTKANTVGDVVSYQIQASDPDAGDSIVSYGATGLPTGLSVNTASGVISGTTSAAGTYAVTISATDNRGATGSTNFTWSVSSTTGTPPSISGFSPTSGSVGTSVTINGSNFTGATDVSFNGVSVSGNFTVNSDTRITTAVPSGATTGRISITTPAGTGTSSNSFTVTGTSGSVLIFSPAADTHVLATRPNKNFGSRDTLTVDGSPVRDVLLKFTVSGIGGSSISSVKIRIYCVNASPTGGAFYRVPSNSWLENTVTWSNAPAADPTAITSLGAVASNTWYEVDVTSFVTGDGTYSLRVTSTSANGATYVSKEGAAASVPQLVVSLA